MPMQVSALVTVAVLAAGLLAGHAALTPEQVKALPPPAPQPVDFSRDIQPIIESRCVNCHGHGRAKGGLRLDDRESLLRGGDSGPAVTPGRSQESLLIALVSGLDPDNVMPQKGTRLTAEQVGLLRAWIDQGLPWSTTVSFGKPAPRNLKPRLPEIPPANSTLPSNNPVDRFLNAYFTAHQIGWAAPIPDRVFARRVFLDVIGLTPSSEELAAFLDDPAPDKRERLVRRLLADNRRYAEHWLAFWNDLLRNDYRGTGYIDGGRKQISAWLFNALLRNEPYDRFVAQLVNPTPETEGFAKGIIWRGVVNASQTPPMQAAQNISQVFMGVNLKCASCHDSFINNWTLAEAYGLANIYSDTPLEIFQCDKPTGKTAGLQFIYPDLGEIDPHLPKPERLKQLAQIMTGKNDGRLSRTIVNRLWHRFFGRGLVEPLDDMEQPAWHPDLLDWLAEDLIAHNYDLKHTIARILTSQAYQQPAVPGSETPGHEFVFHGPFVRRVSAEQFRDLVGLLTGVWHKEPEGEFDFSALSGSLSGLMPGTNAHWIWTEPDAAQKTLPAIVGFRKTFTLDAVPDEALAVVSCDNSFVFYVNGQKAASGSDFTKPVLVNVRPHLRAGQNVFAVEAVNHLPDNSRPKSGQPIPDAAANPAGLYVQAQWHYGTEIRHLGTDASWVFDTPPGSGWEKVDIEDSLWRSAVVLGPADMAPWKLGRALAQAAARNALRNQVRASLVGADPLTVALGRPNREQVTTSRPSAATTLQALELTNGETLARLLRDGARQYLATHPSVTAESLITTFYQRALGRAPTPGELALARAMVGEPVQPEGVEDLLWALAMLPEFQLIL